MAPFRVYLGFCRRRSTRTERPGGGDRPAIHLGRCGSLRSGRRRRAAARTAPGAGQRPGNGRCVPPRLNGVPLSKSSSRCAAFTMCCPRRPRRGSSWKNYARSVRELRLRRVPSSHHRADPAVQAFDRGLHRYRRERDVQLRGPGRGSHHPAPEATAGIARAMISNGLLREGRLKVWCMGPMFRRERPQAGRYRQFHQIDAEAFGFQGPDIDAEMILLSARLLRRLGLTGSSSWSTRSARRRFVPRTANNWPPISAGTKRRSTRTASGACSGNPLRILDSKNPDMQRLIAGAPSMLEALDAESKAHFEALCAHIAGAGIAYHIEPRLVRGLDYYTRTVFEWTTDALGSQSTVCAGGRYDGLIAQLGGASTPGIGWAMGQERIVMLLEKQGPAYDLASASLSGIGRRAYRAAGSQAGRAIARRVAVSPTAGEFGRRKFQDAVQARRQERRRVRARLGRGRTGPRGRCPEGAASGSAQEECPIARISERLGALLGLTGA